MDLSLYGFPGGATFLTQWGSFGAGNGQLDDPNGIATDPAGNVYVVDNGNNRAEKFSGAGAPLAAAPSSFLLTWGSSGTGSGQFNGAYGVTADPNGNVYVADAYNNRVQKFTSTGSYLTQWGSSGAGNGQF